MKSSMILLVLGMVCLSSCKEEVVNAKQMSQWIKARGTFSVSLVNLDETSNSVEQKAFAEDKEKVSAEALGVNLGSKVTGGVLGDQYDLFNNDKVELPIVCNPTAFPNEDFVKWERLTSIATGGKALKNCWATAAGQDVSKIDFLDMPFLNAKQLAEFYKCASAKYETKIDKDYILPADAMLDPPALLTVATFGDFTRTDIGWLEMWVFMCCKAQQPKDSFYLAKDPEAMKALMEKTATRITAQTNNKNKAAIDKAREEAEKKLAEQQKAAGKRLAKTSVFSYATMLAMEKANNSYAKQSKRNRKVEKMIEDNSKAYHKTHQRFNKKTVSNMKLNQQSPELASRIQELFVRAQDPELIQYVKQQQSKRLAKNNKSHKKHK